MVEYFKIKKGGLKGKIFIPPSKSHTMRAILLGSFAKGKTEIHHNLKSPDTFAMIQALRQFGIEIAIQESLLEIKGGSFSACENVIDAGNSGQILRFVGSFAALLPSYTIITGDHSIRHHRPVKPLLSALSQLKAFALSSQLNGKPPIIIRGPIEPGIAELSGIDSQPISGLLMATSFLPGTTDLKVTNPGEKPWIDLTLSWLKRLGGQISHHNYEHYTISGPIQYDGFKTEIPGDFSSATFPLIAALITRSTLTLENLDMGDVQGDKKIVSILREMGAQIEIDQKRKTITVEKSPPLSGITIDANDLIDALPILAVLGCFANGVTKIINASIARQKESDRIAAIVTELKKMGASIEESEDELLILPSPLLGARLFSHADHRIAMALIVASLGAEGESTLEGGVCIQKSYPTFISDFQKIGAQIEAIS